MSQTEPHPDPFERVKRKGERKKKKKGKRKEELQGGTVRSVPSTASIHPQEVVVGVVVGVVVVVEEEMK